MASNVLQAEAMGLATLGDPQFKLPMRPLIAPGLVKVAVPGGVLIEGGPSRQLLGGDRVGELEVLWPLVDGTRTVAEIAEAAGYASGRVHAVVSLLYASGLLEDAATAGESTALDEQSLAFLRRSIDSTRVNGSGAEAAHRLTSTRVGWVADAAHGELETALALELGSLPWKSLASYAEQPDADLLIALGDDTGLRAAVDDAQARGIPVMPARVVGHELFHGPLIDREYSLSFDDLQEQLASEALLHPASGTAGMAAALVAADVVSIVSRVGQSPAQLGLVRTHLSDLVQERLVAVASTEDGMPLAYAFEASTAFPPRKLNSPRDHQVHYKSSNLQLQLDSTVWPSAPTVPLPAPGSAGHGLDLAAVADVIHRSAGNRYEGQYRDGKVHRWAPTGGNLGSVQVYLVARDIDGLAPGVYGYQRGDSTLAKLPWVDPHLAALGAASGAPVSLILTGAMARVASKYGAFGWRIVHLDAGVATAHATALAQHHGARLEVSPAWDDTAIADALALDLGNEPITALLHLLPTSQRKDPA